MNKDRGVTAHLTASPVDSILAQMQGLTITQGWDVVCAMQADRINDLLAQQYVMNLSGGETLPPISDTVPVIENISVQFVDLTLGPPLISFSPTLAPQELNLTIDFLSGTVTTVQVSGSGSARVTTVLSSQVISPEDGYALTGVVPLKSVVGEVQNNHDVVLDIVNGKAFAAGLGITGGAETTLGQYFLTWLQDHISGFQYKLGTLVYNPGGTDLTPAGDFEFATQFDATDPNDKGRLLLFIPTTYHPGGGSQNVVAHCQYRPGEVHSRAHRVEPSAQGSALAVLSAANPTDVAVTPPVVMAPLTPLQTQQFSATVGQVQDQTVTWSVLPVGVGTISTAGLYTAPATITAPQAVLVVATSQVVSVLFGTALVMVAPPSEVAK